VSIPLIRQGEISDLTQLNFLAVLVNELQNPGDTSPLWLCMNEKAKKAQVDRAKVYFEQWKRVELNAQSRRRESISQKENKK